MFTRLLHRQFLVCLEILVLLLVLLHMVAVEAVLPVDFLDIPVVLAAVVVVITTVDHQQNLVVQEHLAKDIQVERVLVLLVFRLQLRQKAAAEEELELPGPLVHLVVPAAQDTHGHTRLILTVAVEALHILPFHL
jgi:hypothetical protein